MVTSQSEGSLGPFPNMSVIVYYFRFSEGYCSTCHTTQYLRLECAAVALGLTLILSSKGMVS